MVINNMGRIAGLIRLLIPERYRPIGYLTALVRTRTADRVRLGPFAGMHYLDGAIGSAFLPKLLGTYEQELGAVIEKVCAFRPLIIINIGAAEGYYAVGLARRIPQAHVIAYEQLAAGRTALTRTALLNGVLARLDVRGQCHPLGLEEDLAKFCGEGLGSSRRRALVLCDTEGDEKRLLDPAEVPSLSRAWVLVETHEFIHPGVTEELSRRFAPTHKVEQIRQQARSRTQFPFHTGWMSVLPKSYLDWAVSEWRPERMSWLWMSPHG